MASAAQFRVQHVTKAPAGWKVRTQLSGKHRIRIAYPPGKRQKGSGKVVEVLHPKGENPKCAMNPAELVIFGNPHKASPAKRRVAIKRQPRSIGKAIPEEGKYDLRKLREVRRKALSKNARRRNQEDQGDLKQAVHLFQTFHGKDPQQVLEKQETAAMRLNYTTLGNLDYLLIERDDGKQVKIDFEGDGVKLASAPEGRQLYCIGGNQNLERVLDQFKTDDSKDFIDLGECVEVQYEARKAHNNFELTGWHHKFTRPRPQIMYNAIQRRIFFVGGNYFIEGNVDLSPGIEH